ncbi:MAG: hypothetical protein MI799_20620, partial [Desulfobacterales bacterium]|nr:hypothetical protein [Desulfobacterales bacterium]
REIYYPIPDEIKSSDNHMILTYENIGIDETITLDPMPLFERTFGLEYDEIIIKRVNLDDYPLGTEYFPSQDLDVVLDTEETMHYELTDEMLLMTYTQDDLEGYVTYELDEAVIMTSTHSAPVTFSNIILPERIFEGLSWNILSFDYVIKEVDREFIVDGINYPCVVVEEYYEGSITGLLYYGKDVGLIKKHGYSSASFEAVSIKNSQ